MVADFYVASVAEAAPLVIFVHGYDSTRAAHSNQAAHVASWGMHALTIQLPNQGPWIPNGRILANVVRLIHSAPKLLENAIDRDVIVLAGHSFGASSVIVALAEGAPAAGAVLLDPAASDREIPTFLRRIAKPVMILGADEEIAPVRDRAHFFRYIPRNVAEVSVRGAAHEDAQYPSEFALQFGSDPDTTEELQVTFAGAIAVAAFSMAATRRLEYAWRVFEAALDSGALMRPKKK